MTRLAIIAVSTLLLGSCYGCPSPRALQCEWFFEMPKEQRDREFRTYPLEKQLEIYDCGMSWEPPYLEYADLIAEGGEKNIPILLEKLKGKDTSIFQRDITRIFAAMAEQGHLNGRQDVVQQIERVVAAMDSTWDKEFGEMHLSTIKDNAK